MKYVDPDEDSFIHHVKEWILSWSHDINSCPQFCKVWGKKFKGNNIVGLDSGCEYMVYISESLGLRYAPWMHCILAWLDTHELGIYCLVYCQRILFLCVLYNLKYTVNMFRRFVIISLQKKYETKREEDERGKDKQQKFCCYSWARACLGLRKYGSTWLGAF